MFVQLIEPDGTLNFCVTEDFAVRYCQNHPGWTWRMRQEDDPCVHDWHLYGNKNGVPYWACQTCGLSHHGDTPPE